MEVVIGRVIASDGRSGKARINGRLVPVALLGEIGARTGRDRRTAPASADLETAVSTDAPGPSRRPRSGRDSGELRDTVRTIKETIERIEELSETETERGIGSSTSSRFEISEIEGASITAGESARLNEEAGRLENADRLASGLGARRRSARGTKDGPRT